jgi:hypothetical protein
MTTVRVRCQRCHGTGSIELTGIYRDTLELLRSQKGECTGAQLARISGCKGTAMNNRLAALERHGLAVSRRYGREKLFRFAHAKRAFDRKPSHGSTGPSPKSIP